MLHKPASAFTHHSDLMWQVLLWLPFYSRGNGERKSKQLSKLTTAKQPRRTEAGFKLKQPGLRVPAPDLGTQGGLLNDWVAG